MSDTNLALRQQKMARGLKFLVLEVRDFSSYICGSVYGTHSQWQKVYIFPNFDEKIPNLTEKKTNFIICPYRYCLKVKLMLLMNPVSLIYL